MKKILVTGADGFIGKALCEVLSRNGHEVHGAVLSEDLAGHLPDKVVPVVCGDIGGDADLTDITRGIDLVIHLAARVHVMRETVDDPLREFMRVNAEGTRNLARAASVEGVKKFIFLSSVKVNGEATYGRPFTAGDQPNTRDPYGISKFKAEEAIKDVCADKKMGFCIVRPTLVYGPGVKGNFLRLLKWVDKGIPLPLGGVKNLRSMIYLENLIDALSALVEADDVRDEVFLISDDEDMSTPQLIRVIANAMGKKPRLVNLPPGILKVMGTMIGKADEVDRLTGSLCVDNEKIQNMLKWQPPFSFEEGVNATVKWYRKERR